MDLQARTTVDPTTMDADDVAELTRTLRAAGVREHVLQEVRTEGVRPDYRDRLAALAR